MWVENSRGSLGQRLEVAPRRRDRAQAADELHPHTLPHLLGLAQQDGADLPGAAHVRPAAGVQVEVADVDEAQLLALGGRNFAHAHGARFVGRGEANLDRHGLRR